MSFSTVTPAEFGTMAICLAIMGYFQIVSKFGLGAALISAKDKVEETANAVFYTAIVLSSLMAFVMWQGAGVLAGFFETPELESLLGVICLGLIATALSTVNHVHRSGNHGFRGLGAGHRVSGRVHRWVCCNNLHAPLETRTAA